MLKEVNLNQFYGFEDSNYKVFKEENSKSKKGVFTMLKERKEMKEILKQEVEEAKNKVIEEFKIYAAFDNENCSMYSNENVQLIKTLEIVIENRLNNKEHACKYYNKLTNKLIKEKEKLEKQLKHGITNTAYNNSKNMLKMLFVNPIIVIIIFMLIIGLVSICSGLGLELLGMFTISSLINIYTKSVIYGIIGLIITCCVMYIAHLAALLF